MKIIKSLIVIGLSEAWSKNSCYLKPEINQCSLLADCDYITESGFVVASNMKVQKYYTD